MRALILVLSFAPALAFADGAVSPQIDRVWRARCASCHGVDGKAQTEQGKKMAIRDMTTADWQKTTDDKIKAVISDGLKTEKDGVKQEMEGYKSKLRPEQIDGLLGMVRSLKK